MSQTVAMMFGVALLDWIPTDGTQGTPDRAKGVRKQRGGDADNWSAFDLAMARIQGHTRQDMNRRREDSRAWHARFQDEVRRSLIRVPAGKHGF